MGKINLFINNNSGFVTVIIAFIGCLIIGYAYDILEIMLELFLGAVIFGALVGLIFYLIKMFSK